MTQNNNQALIKKIEDLEKELENLKIELKYPTRNVKKSKRLIVGDTVDILNPGRNQDRSGVITKVNYSTGRATVETNTGKVSRIFRNLRKRKQE